MAEVSLELEQNILSRIDQLTIQYETAGRRLTREEMMRALLHASLDCIEQSPPPSRIVKMRSNAGSKPCA